MCSSASRSPALPRGTPVLPTPAGSTLTGRIVNTHHSRPPVFTFFNGAPVTECWVGLNEPLGGRALYATACKKDSTFSIPNVPNGTYELAIWDDPLDMIISATTITVGSASNKNLGDLPVSSWFGRYQGRVFQDIDGTGLPYFAAGVQPPVHLGRSGHRAGDRRHRDLQRGRPQAAVRRRHRQQHPLPRRQHLPVDHDQERRHVRLHGSVPVLQLHGRRNRLCALQGHQRHGRGGRRRWRSVDTQDQCRSEPREALERRTGPVRQQRSGAQLTTRGLG